MKDERGRVRRRGENNKAFRIRRLYVVLAGVEPATHGFSVHCSTT